VFPLLPFAFCVLPFDLFYLFAVKKDEIVALTGHRTFVGFGFGAIQAGLFLYEAFRSGGFARLVVGEVAPDAVDALRRNAGCYAVNVAHADRVEAACVGPVQIENPAAPQDLARLVDAVAEAEEISTAVPNVRFYSGPGPGSIHRILAQGLRKKAAAGGPRAVVYAAENHNHAAEILEAAVFAEIPATEKSPVRERVCFLNTVIGKMSGVIADAGEIQVLELATVTPDSSRAFLVEAFNRILISQVCFPQAAGEPRFHRGIAAFTEKEDLLPFEEAKLYGHNATHALAAYLGSLCGLSCIADLRQKPDLLAFIRAAFLEESGEALIRKHAGKDRLFTPDGYREYADDLLERMTNPHLQDTVERVGRDPHRKLGWDDRLVGTMRVALQQNVAPRRYALGAAAALATLDPTFLKTDMSARALLAPIWGDEAMESKGAHEVLRLIEDAKLRLQRWGESGFEEIDRL
jgi:mannitol-1-phosphate 5-dehydrogenase